MKSSQAYGKGPQNAAPAILNKVLDGKNSLIPSNSTKLAMPDLTKTSNKTLF
jgi:hypothetical protein